jgi:hypothetical protein
LTVREWHVHEPQAYKLELATRKNMPAFLLSLLQLLDDPLVDPEELHAILALDDNLLALAEEIFCFTNYASGSRGSRGRGSIKAAFRSDRPSSSSFEDFGKILYGCRCRVNWPIFLLG